MGDMITALDAYLCPGSHLTLFNHVPLDQREARLRQGYRTIDPVNVTIEHVSTCIYIYMCLIMCSCFQKKSLAHFVLTRLVQSLIISIIPHIPVYILYKLNMLYILYMLFNVILCHVLFCYAMFCDNKGMRESNYSEGSGEYRPRGV